MKVIKTYWNNLVHLVSPNSCVICKEELPNAWSGICKFCRQKLPYTLHETYQDESNLDKLFWGRQKLSSTFALLNYEKGLDVQMILHQIKYKGDKGLAIACGEEIGERIGKNVKYKDIDVLVPVPLHHIKQFQRGYNQSALIAKGIEKASKILMNENLVKRVAHTQSQTTKNRFQRWDNVETKFELNDLAALKKYKHLALVDDVITTGSTLEAIVKLLRDEVPDLKISILALAMAK